MRPGEQPAAMVEMTAVASGCATALATSMTETIPEGMSVPAPCLHPLSRYSRGQPLDDGAGFVWPTSLDTKSLRPSRDSARPSSVLPPWGYIRVCGFRR